MSQIGDILSAVYARAAAISGIETAAKRKRQFNNDELPAVAVYRGVTSQEDASASGAQKIRVPVIVEYHAAANADPAEQAETMTESVLAAVEAEDEFLGGLLCEEIISDGGDRVELPEDAGGVVSVQVPFSAVFIRQYGGGA